MLLYDICYLEHPGTSFQNILFWVFVSGQPDNRITAVECHNDEMDNCSHLHLHNIFHRGGGIHGEVQSE